jgi:outer membrane protein assembly factor BamB
VVVLSADGNLYRLDQTGAVLDTWPVIAPWTGPAKWQDPHPALTVVGETAYITEPAKNQILAFDLATGTTTATGTLAHTPNEIAVVGS